MQCFVAFKVINNVTRSISNTLFLSSWIKNRNDSKLSAWIVNAGQVTRTIWGECCKTFLSVIYEFCNKLECLLLSTLFSQVYCLWATPGAYPWVQHLRVFHLGRLLSLPCKHYTILEMLARNKHSSLLQIIVTNAIKSFITLVPGASVIKLNFFVRNLRIFVIS